MRILIAGFIALMLNGCVGLHVYTGADDKRLEDMTILLHMSDYAGVQECADTFLPVLGLSTFTKEPLEERFKDMDQGWWDTDRPENPPLSISLPLIKYADNRIEMVECNVCVVADKNILWEEIVSRCAGGRDVIPLSF